MSQVGRRLVGGSCPLEHKYIIDATAAISKVRVWCVLCEVAAAVASDV